MVSANTDQRTLIESADAATEDTPETPGILLDRARTYKVYVANMYILYLFMSKFWNYSVNCRQLSSCLQEWYGHFPLKFVYPSFSEIFLIQYTARIFPGTAVESTNNIVSGWLGLDKNHGDIRHNF